MSRGPVFAGAAGIGIVPKAEAVTRENSRTIMAEKRTRVPAGLLTAGILFASHPVMAAAEVPPFEGSHVGRRGLGWVTASIRLFLWPL